MSPRAARTITCDASLKGAPIAPLERRVAGMLLYPNIFLF
jgi:hypothetical protein